MQEVLTNLTANINAPLLPIPEPADNITSSAAALTVSNVSTADKNARFRKAVQQATGGGRRSMQQLPGLQPSLAGIDGNTTNYVALGSRWTVPKPRTRICEFKYCVIMA